MRGGGNRRVGGAWVVGVLTPKARQGGEAGASGGPRAWVRAFFKKDWILFIADSCPAIFRGIRGQRFPRGGLLRRGGIFPGFGPRALRWDETERKKTSVAGFLRGPGRGKRLKRQKARFSQVSGNFVFQKGGGARLGQGRVYKGGETGPLGTAPPPRRGLAGG